MGPGKTGHGKMDNGWMALGKRVYGKMDSVMQDLVRIEGDLSRFLLGYLGY